MIGLVLTYNEEKHIGRCLESLSKVCNKIIVTDSFSNDQTVNICKKFDKVTILQNKFLTHRDQLHWTLKKIELADKWFLKIDADEYLDDSLILSLSNFSPAHLKGFKINRTIYFDGKPVTKGGQFPIKIVRLFHIDYALIDDRPMDEKIVINGKIGEIKKGLIIDDNKNNIDWWIQKHLHYAKLEALIQFSSIAKKLNSKKNQKIYYLLPSKFASIILFFYRFFLRHGFLGSKENIYFLLFQTLWYRTLVSHYLNRLKKVSEIKRLKDKASIIEIEFGILYGTIFRNLQ